MAKNSQLDKLLTDGIGFMPENTKVMVEKAPEVLSAYMEMRNKLLAEGALDRKTKILMALAIMVTSGMREAIPNYIQIARNLGASDAEIIEAAGVGVSFAGGRGIDYLITLCRHL
ncbi:MAG: carboxymuconolactone decarboxylase family protein [Clostridia bacterium]|nr:MAG: carboxymuconolactone decarboxylase family protein [Clostridia bacterium]